MKQAISIFLIVFGLAQAEAANECLEPSKFRCNPCLSQVVLTSIDAVETTTCTKVYKTGKLSDRLLFTEIIRITHLKLKGGVYINHSVIRIPNDN